MGQKVYGISKDFKFGAVTFDLWVERRGRKLIEDLQELSFDTDADDIENIIFESLNDAFMKGMGVVEEEKGD